MKQLCLTEHVKKPNFSGKLLTDGKLEDNCIFFRFVFDKVEMVHPLIITIKTLPISSLGGISEEHSGHERKIYAYKCNNEDSSNRLMQTDLIYPEFPLRDYKIETIDIDSQVSCCICDKNLTELQGV